MCPTFPARLPLPISTLHFTTDNLLDTLLVDVVQPHQHQHQHQTLYRPRYAIETIEDETSVYQLASSTTTPNEKSSLVGCIKWHPKHAHPTFVSAFNQTVAASDFLKKSVLGGTRKFHVPGQSSPLKWKHVGNRYECTLCSHACTAHRAVAIFDPPRPTRRQTAGSLSLYVSSIASDHINGGEFEIDHDGDLVDPTLLVHLILTCILIAHPHHAPSRTHTRSAIEHRHHVKSQTIPIQHSQPHSHSSPSHSANKSLSKCALKCGPIEVNTVKERIDLIGDEDGDDMETSLGGGGSSRAPSSPFSPFSPVTITTSSHTSMPSPMLHPSSPTMLYPPSPNMYPSSHSHSPLMPPSPLYPASHLPANVSIVVPSPGSTSSHTCSLPASPITPISSSASSSSHHNCQSHPRSSPRGGFIEPIAAINSETFTSSQTNNYAATTHTHTHPHAHTNNHHNHHHHQHHLSQHREYAPTPTRPPTSSTASMFATMSGQMYAFAHAMGRSRSNGSSTSKRNNNGSGSNNSSTHNLASTSVPSATTIGHKVHRTSSSSSTGHRGTTNPGGPRSSSSSGPRSATSCFFNFHPKPGNNNNNSATNTYNGTNNSSTNNLNGTGAEMAPGPNAITPYYLPPAPVHPPPPVPPPLQVQIMQPVGTSGSPSRNALLLDTRSPITPSGGTIASPPALTTPLPPSPMIRYTTEMYHLQFSDSALPPPPASPTLAAYDDSTMMMHYSNQHHNYGPTTTSSPLMLSVPIPPSSPVRVRGMTTTGSSTLPPSPLVIPLAPPPPLPIHSATTLSAMSPNSYSSSATTTTTTATSTAHTSPTSASTITSPTSPTTTAANANVSSPTRPIRIFQEVPAPTSWDELPPAYSEIEWTIRVREPRRGRQQQQQQRTHDGEEEEERRRGAGGGLQLVTV
ncbi:hypothetical protein FRC20_000869 [Serendipita sp. 405]|nr:hypothetical protein FRC20_000869 [Serendipita sp. 405]